MVIKQRSWVVGTSICVLAIAGLSPGLRCVNREESRLLSPDAAREVVLFARLCDAAYTGEVAIVSKGAALASGAGNVPLLDHPETVGARWVAPDSVVIMSPTADRSPQEFRVEGVKVRYVRQ